MPPKAVFGLSQHNVRDNSAVTETPSATYLHTYVPPRTRARAQDDVSSASLYSSFAVAVTIQIKTPTDLSDRRIQKRCGGNEMRNDMK